MKIFLSFLFWNILAVFLLPILIYVLASKTQIDSLVWLIFLVPILSNTLLFSIFKRHKNGLFFAVIFCVFFSIILFLLFNYFSSHAIDGMDIL